MGRRFGIDDYLQMAPEDRVAIDEWVKEHCPMTVEVIEVPEGILVYHLRTDAAGKAVQRVVNGHLQYESCTLTDDFPWPCNRSHHQR